MKTLPAVVLDDIEKDIDRTFPRHVLFASGTYVCIELCIEYNINKRKETQTCCVSEWSMCGWVGGCCIYIRIDIVLSIPYIPCLPNHAFVFFTVVDSSGQQSLRRILQWNAAIGNSLPKWCFILHFFFTTPLRAVLHWYLFGAI